MAWGGQAQTVSLYTGIFPAARTTTRSQSGLGLLQTFGQLTRLRTVPKSGLLLVDASFLFKIFSSSGRKNPHICY